MWKIKSMVVLETIYHNIMDIIDNGPHIPTFDETKDDVKTGVIKKNPKHIFREQDKQLFNLDVHARVAIGNFIPYDTYHLVQHYVLAKKR